MRKSTLQIKIEWVPGHQNIEGNEKVDQEAKHAANKGTIPWDDLPSKELTNTEENQRTMERRKHKRPLVETGVKYYKNIKTRKHLRLRTGHCSLNKYLDRFHIADNATSACKEGEEALSPTM
jgi:hypothetical protein